MFKKKDLKDNEFGTVCIQCTLYPTAEQKALLNKYFGHSRFVYNWAIDYNKQLYENEKKSLSYQKLQNLLPDLKKQEATSFLKEVDSTSLQQALQDYSQAFGMFLKRKGGYPKYRSKKRKETFRVINVGDTVRLDGNMVRIGKFGWVRTKPNQSIPKGTIQYITVRRTKTGKVIATLAIRKSEPHTAFPKTNKEAGIDVGVKNFAIYTDGTVIVRPAFFEQDDKKIRRLYRELSRKQKGSKNREKTRQKLAIACEKDSNRRTDFLNKLSLSIVREYDFIAMESLDIKSMLKDKKNRKLHKAISRLGWYEFMQKVQYKALWYGKEFIQIDKGYPSSQICSHCGYKNPEIKDLSIREWKCPVCHTEHDRDSNAALNILREGKRIAEQQ